MFKQARVMTIFCIIMLASFTVVSEAKEVKLTYWVGLTDPGEIEIIETLTKEFEAANPGISVDVTPMAREDMDATLRMAIGSGSGPNIANFDVGDAFLGALARAGLVYDMTEDYKSKGWDKRVFQWAIDTVTYDGKIWAVPIQQEGQGLWYNRALFEKHGWPIPDTWDNFLAAATAAKEAGYIPIAHGTATLPTAPQLLACLVYGLIPPDIVWDASKLEGSTTWADDPRFLQAVQTLVEWNNNGWLPDNPNALQHADYVQILLQGKAAMGALGPWNAANARDAWEDGAIEPIFIAFPAQDSSFPLVNQGAPGNSTMITRNTDADKIQAALDYIEYLFIRSESQQTWLFQNGTLPVTREDIDPQKFESEAMKSVWDGHAYLGERGGVSGQWLDHFVSPEASEVFNNGQQRLLANGWTPEEFIKQISKATIQARKQAGK